MNFIRKFPLTSLAIIVAIAAAAVIVIAIISKIDSSQQTQTKQILQLHVDGVNIIADVASYEDRDGVIDTATIDGMIEVHDLRWVYVAVYGTEVTCDIRINGKLADFKASPKGDDGQVIVCSYYTED